MTRSYRDGATVYLFGKACTVLRTVDLTKLLVRNDDTGETQVVDVADLGEAADDVGQPDQHHEALSDAAHAEAVRRWDIIQPLLSLTGQARSRAARDVAAASGASRATIYRWLKAYEDRRLLSDLAPDRPKTRKGRLSKKVEAIVKSAIDEFYLTRQKRTQKATYEEVVRRCRAARLKAPSLDTVRARIKTVDERERVKRRHGSKAARDRFAEVKDNFPGGDWPLAVVQIDHTLLDIEVVDDETRQAIGRPFLTLAIDTWSRMVTGYYLSLDPPSAFSVGMCLRHSILEKDVALKGLGVGGEWPVWGLMDVLHADNGKDFRSETIKRACDQYGIRMEWRPVRTPHYGGHIERLMGSVATEIHALPGTTFSNVRQRGEYKSAPQAVMTLDELNRWLTNFIVGVYHTREHTAIGEPPIARWRKGILGDGKRKGRGLPEPVADVHRLRIDFLPISERTVQREGIALDNVWYFSDALRPWISARQRGQSMKFQVRRDPRDISRLYFFDPKLGDYLEIPYRNIARPSMSLWELRAIQRYMREHGRKLVDENAIFAAREEMLRIEEAATKETRKTRRQKQRKKQNAAGLARDRAGAPPSTTPASQEHLRLVIDNKPKDGRLPPPPDDDDDVFDLPEEDIKPKWEPL